MTRYKGRGPFMLTGRRTFPAYTWRARAMRTLRRVVERLRRILRRGVFVGEREP